MAAAFAMGGLLGAVALTGITSVSAQSTGSLFIFSAPQTNVSGQTSGSVFVQTQNLATPADLIYQTTPLVVDIAVSDETTGITVPTIPASVTVPAGGVYATFVYTADNSSTTTAGTFEITVTPAGGTGAYGAVSQTETVDPLLAPSGTSVTPGYNGSLVAPVPVAIGGTATFFSVSGSGIDNTSGSTQYYEVTTLNGAFSSGGGGSITGLGVCTTAPTATTTKPTTVTVVNSPDRPAGTYPLEFVVESFTAAGCATVSGYYSGTSSLIVANGAYTALAPDRLLDTRASGGPLGAGATRSLTVTGVDSVPTNATAVAINVTATEPTQASYLSVVPAGTTPTISNLNFRAGETVPNFVVVPVGTGGAISFYNSVGSVDFLVDLEGYFAPEAASDEAGSYVSLTPVRICDTRPVSVTGQASDSCTGHTLTQGGTLAVTVDGVDTVPATNVSAIVANVTVTNTSAASYLTAYPSGATPTASNLNWSAGETVANRVIIPVNGSGGITLYNSVGKTDAIVDVDGYFTSGASQPSGESLLTTVSPTRVLDTRNTSPLGAGGTVSQNFQTSDALSPFGGNASAVVINVTVTDTNSVSYLTVYPGGSRPVASDLNWGPGQTVPNLDIAALSSAGALTVYNAVGSTEVLLDVFGFFSPDVT